MLPPIKIKYKHREAYCLMKYAIIKYSQVGNYVGEEELIWNSRDGVAPFLIKSEGGKELIHINWKEDKFAPHHILTNGDRYFADMSRARAEFLARKWVQKNGHYPEYSIEETIFMLTKDYYGDGHKPTILKYGESVVEYYPYED